MFGLAPILVTLMLISNQAYSNTRDKIRLNGFLGIGSATVNRNNFLGEGRDSALIIDASVNATYSIDDNFSVQGQLSYREFGDNISDDKPRIDYLNVTYVTNQLLSGEHALSLGRVKSKSGIYNEFRDIPTAKPSILLPQSVYLDVFRNLLLSIDGVSLNSSFDTEVGNFQFQLSLGEINLDDGINETSFGSFVNGKWHEDDAFLADFRWSNSGYLLSFSYSEYVPMYFAAPGDFVRVSPELPAINVVDGEVVFTHYVYSLQKNWNTFELVAEYAYRVFGVRRLLEYPVGAQRPMEGYYLQGRYNLNASTTILLRWERYFRNADDKNGERIRTFGLESWADNAITKTIGLKYQLNKSWSVFTEVHHITGSGYLPPFVLTSAASVESKDSVLWATEFVYRF
ncbi:hypothetical protein [Agaribacter flavus]|uniref:Porin n=1 Tax=Agaribacter flavus TaxID=1902781 RepID=A0ABV7FRV8_9ALTE